MVLNMKIKSFKLNKNDYLFDNGDAYLDMLCVYCHCNQRYLICRFNGELVKFHINKDLYFALKLCGFIGYGEYLRLKRLEENAKS